MKIKQKMGMGLKNKSGRSLRKVRRKEKRSTKKRGAPTFGSLVRKAKIAVKGVKEKDIRDESTLKQKVQLALKAIGSRKGILPNSSKIIPIPKSGGMLPLIPLITGISKIGAIAGGTSAIINAIRDIINMRKSVRDGDQRPVGNGLFLAPYRKGYGLFFTPSKKLSDFKKKLPWHRPLTDSDICLSLIHISEPTRPY